MLKSTIKWFREHRLAYNLALIAALYVVIALVSYVAMALGTRHGMKRTVPDFVGLQLSDADYFASRRGLNVIVADSLYVPAYPGGIVLDQLPEAGVDVKSGRKIYVTINSVAQKQVRLPYVAGRSLRQAKNMLEGAGLAIRELVYVEDIATNYVLAQYVGEEEITPETDRTIEMGSGVTLHVGVAGGERMTVVPKLLGRPLAEAKGKLWESGLNVGEVVYDEGMEMLERNAARVWSQSVPTGAEATLGGRVSLFLTASAEKLAEAEAAYARRIREAEIERMRADSVEQALRMQADSLKALELMTAPATTPAPEPVPEDEFFM